MILVQKLIPFLFRIEKKLSKNRYLNNPKKIHNFRQKFRGAKLLPETQFTIHMVGNNVGRYNVFS
ncbi:MAG: hypothetical protein DRR08_32285 [Candidatus Parabeggiatoa sp. nov. 2]|nr:MAG: hypothetical protein B6247_31375 [Beggiatoa sp. 4572_84]RKZ47667.1 MAG: hypothetical protein DRR08_32285 [Gammaproteobacteria bacterium]